MARRKKAVTEPLYPEFMLPVNNYNRKKLEAKYGIEIPVDVTYIIPPTALSDVRFWNQDLPERAVDNDEELLDWIQREYIRARENS